jgi:hypothetical protein
MTPKPDPFRVASSGNRVDAQLYSADDDRGQVPMRSNHPQARLVTGDACIAGQRLRYLRRPSMHVPAVDRDKGRRCTWLWRCQPTTAVTIRITRSRHAASSAVRATSSSSWLRGHGRAQVLGARFGHGNHDSLSTFPHEQYSTLEAGPIRVLHSCACIARSSQPLAQPKQDHR